MIQADCIVESKDILGEVPLWSARHQRLYWIDVRRPALQSYDLVTEKVERFELPEAVGSFCESKSGDMLLALKSGLYTFDTSSYQLDEWLNIEPDLPNNRLNDGKCDRQGRFWVGSMNDGDRLPTGSLYRIDADKKYEALLANITIPNSLAWSPDGNLMYFADTPSLKIMVYDFDTVEGIPHTPRVFRDMSGHPGRPDGATVDIDGCLWSAEVRGSRVVRYTPKGEIDKIVQLPVTGVTSCAFGGPKLDTLYITTATQRLSAEELARQPLAGALFAVAVGTQGVPEMLFLG